MTKIVLGKRPDSFEKPVSFLMLDGSTGVINCKFKYRTKKEFGVFIDAVFKDAAEADVVGEAPAAPLVGTAADVSMADLMARTVDKNADYLLDVLKGWDLDQPLSRTALAQLSDELPAAATQIMTDYRTAIVEGRLGN